ncbi:LysR family transcriptional regulator [Terrabacter sp. RAF57]
MSNRTSVEPNKPQIEAFLTLETGPAARDMLRIFTEGADSDGMNSFAAVAKALKTDKRIVSRELHRLDAKFEELTGGTLLDREGIQYQLTPAGRLFGEELITQHRNLMETVRRASKRHKEGRMPVTENLLPEFSKLQKRLRRGKEKIELYPDPRRSSDLLPSTYLRDESRSNPQLFPYAMYSVCADASDLRKNRVGKIPTIEDTDIDVIVIDIEPFKIMASTRTFGGVPSLSVSDIWSHDQQFVVPDGGAVRTFLSAVEDGWEGRHNHTEATDYSFCAACLANDSVPNPAMIVHGSRKPVDGFSLYDIEDHPELQAVTGVFRRQARANRLQSTKRNIWEKVWAAATDEFTDAASDTGESGAA